LQNNESWLRRRKISRRKNAKISSKISVESFCLGLLLERRTRVEVARRTASIVVRQRANPMRISIYCLCRPSVKKDILRCVFVAVVDRDCSDVERLVHIDDSICACNLVTLVDLLVAQRTVTYGRISRMKGVPFRRSSQISTKGQRFQHPPPIFRDPCVGT
jgi:hypothetical protein